MVPLFGITPLPNISGLPRAGELHLWSASLPIRLKVSEGEGANSPHSDLRALLSGEELARAERYQTRQAQEQFILVRSLLRCLLGQYLQQSPTAIQFCYSIHGKPELFPTSPQLYFNLSHSQGMVLFAVRQGQPVGLDLEWINPKVNGMAIARRVFLVQEQAEIFDLPLEQQQAKFFQIWTRKEALIKLYGDRLFPGLKAYDVSEYSSTSSFKNSQKHCRSTSTLWLKDLAMLDSFAAAVATIQQPHHLQHHTWDWETSPATQR